MKKKRYFLYLILIAFLMTSCGSVGFVPPKIKEITEKPGEFRDKEITIEGTVTETVAIPMINKGFYKIDDGTGDLWVRPAKNVPYRGDKTKVKGTLKIGITIGGKNFGLLLVEEGNEE